MAVLLLGMAVSVLAIAPACAEGDPARGERVFQYCYACHSVEPGETNLSGPNLRGILGRPIAAQAGFDYSPALRALAARHRAWSAALLDRYVAAPEETAPNTTMAFRGIDDPREREDLLAYLLAVQTISSR
jgi:cytochrome c